MSTHYPSRFKWRRRPDSNRGIRALQAPALPLGHAASNVFLDPKDNWTDNLCQIKPILLISQ